MEDEYNITIELLKKQKGKLMEEIDKNANLDNRIKIIDQIINIDSKIKKYYEEIKNNKIDR